MIIKVGYQRKVQPLPRIQDRLDTLLEENEVRGPLTLAVPTADALLDNMLNLHGFSVSMGGRTVAEVEWTGGNAARDKVRACLKKTK